MSNIHLKVTIETFSKKFVFRSVFGELKLTQISLNFKLNKNETELKMENPTHSFRQTNLVLQLISESQTKSKTVMRWSS